MCLGQLTVEKRKGGGEVGKGGGGGGEGGEGGAA